MGISLNPRDTSLSSLKDLFGAGTKIHGHIDGLFGGIRHQTTSFGDKGPSSSRFCRHRNHAKIHGLKKGKAKFIAARGEQKHIALLKDLAVKRSIWLGIGHEVHSVRLNPWRFRTYKGESDIARVIVLPAFQQNVSCFSSIIRSDKQQSYAVLAPTRLCKVVGKWNRQKALTDARSKAGVIFSKTRRVAIEAIQAVDCP